MARLKNKTAIVTGGARGIGRATAELFALQGARVFVADLAFPGEDFVSPGIRPMLLDVSRAEAWQALVEQIVNEFGGVDILVNNAAIGGSAQAVAEETLAEWDRVVAVNMTGVLIGMRAVLPSMRTRRCGSIVNFSSIWGNVGVPAMAAYHATKGAVRTLTKHAAVAYAPDNVRVNSIHPGITATTPVLVDQPQEVSAAIVRATPLGRMAQPIEIANGVLFLASDESSFMTGSELVIDGGYLAQ